MAREVYRPFRTEPDPAIIPSSAQNIHNTPSQELIRRQPLAPMVTNTEDPLILACIVPAVNPIVEEHTPTHSSTIVYMADGTDFESFFRMNRGPVASRFMDIGDTIEAGAQVLDSVGIVVGGLVRQKINSTNFRALVGGFVFGNTFKDSDL